MDSLFTVDSLRTLAGAATAVYVVTEFTKNLFGVAGKWNNLLALVIAETLTVGLMCPCWRFDAVVTAAINGVVVCVTAFGLYKGLNLNKVA